MEYKMKTYLLMFVMLCSLTFGTLWTFNDDAVGNSNWSDPDNWVSDSIPEAGAGNTAYVPAGLVCYIDQDISIGNLQNNADGQFWVSYSDVDTMICNIYTQSGATEACVKIDSGTGSLTITGNIETTNTSNIVHALEIDHPGTVIINGNVNGNRSGGQGSGIATTETTGVVNLTINGTVTGGNQTNWSFGIYNGWCGKAQITIETLLGGNTQSWAYGLGWLVTPDTGSSLTIETVNFVTGDCFPFGYYVPEAFSVTNWQIDGVAVGGGGGSSGETGRRARYVNP